MKERPFNYVGKVIVYCEIVDRANFGYLIARAGFNNQHRATLWANAFICNARLKALRKYGDDFQEALFGYEPTFSTIEFDPERPRLAV